MMRKYKYQEGGEVRSAIGNEPVGERLRRAFRQGPSQRPAREPSGSPAGQRPTEDRARMAAEAAAEFDREEADLAARAAARRQERANRPSRITNDPVGSRLAGRAAPAPTAPARETPMADYEERMQRGALPAGRSAAPGPMGQYEESAAAGSVARPRPRPRPQPRAAAPSGEDAERERQRIAMGAVLSEMMRGGEEQPRERGFFERLGIRRTNETGMDPATIEMRRNYLGSSGATDTSTSYNKKGGLLKAQAPMKKGGKVMKYREGGPIRQGMQSPKAQEGRAEMAEDVMRRERAREPISEAERRAARMEERMSPGAAEDFMRMRDRERAGFKKGGMIKPKAKTAMKKGGVVKKAAGGKVAAPKKMMKGGKVAAKPAKKMMGGGRAMYAKGGMAKGCK